MKLVGKQKLFNQQKSSPPMQYTLLCIFDRNPKMNVLISVNCSHYEHKHKHCIYSSKLFTKKTGEKVTSGFS